jgi:hypothetical protein
MRLQDVTIWIVWLTGVVGGLVVPARWRTRVALAMVGVGGTFALMLLRPLASAGGVEVLLGWWGLVVIPSVLALAPLAFSRIPGVRTVERGVSAPASAVELQA